MKKNFKHPLKNFKPKTGDLRIKKSNVKLESVYEKPDKSIINAYNSSNILGQGKLNELKLN